MTSGFWACERFTVGDAKAIEHRDTGAHRDSQTLTRVARDSSREALEAFSRELFLELDELIQDG